jgi:mannan endo-1,6-alpha-mannosidase
VATGLLAQTGPNNDFMPPNQTSTEGNDDQSFWALAALSAAELKFPTPSTSNVSWVTYAENVWNEQILRWDTGTCGGGLRWQIFPFNSGYTYKNSPANGNLFQLSTRLARYTGNSTYLEWANKVLAWSQQVKLVSADWKVFDGANVEANCSSVNKLQLSDVAGSYLAGAAAGYNISSGSDQSLWKSRVDGLLNTTMSVFFKNGVAEEVACETIGTCNPDMKASKGILAQALVRTVQLAPYTKASIMSILGTTAVKAAAACGSKGEDCALQWGTTTGTKNGTGVGEMISVLSFVQALLVGESEGLATQSTGGSNGTATSTSTTSGTSTASSGKSSSTGNSAASMKVGGSSEIVLMGMLAVISWVVL